MRTVLLVDDDEEIRHVLRIVFEEEGYPVQEAVDGLAALDLLRHSGQPMVVLLDLMMPRLSGAGVLGVVAAEPLLAERHSYILLTAMGRALPRPLLTLLDALDTPVLGKPLDLDALIQAVACIELRKRQRRQKPQWSTDGSKETLRKCAAHFGYDGIDGRPHLASSGRDGGSRIH